MSAVRGEFSLVERRHASNVRPDMKSLHGRGTETSAASGVLTELLCLHVRSCHHLSPAAWMHNAVCIDSGKFSSTPRRPSHKRRRGLGAVTARGRCSPRPPPTSTSASAHKSDLEVAPQVNKGFHKANVRLQPG